MSEPEFTDQTPTDSLYQKLWPYRVPVIFFALGIIFLATAVFLFYQETIRGQSVVISNPYNSSNPPNPSVIKADVEGAVVSPGVYELKVNSRIQDLLIKAGGLSIEADREYVSKNINLAQKLSDGAKIYIPSVGESSSNLSNLSHLININQASARDLESLPGVGPATSAKIISGRPYQTTEELISKKAVGKAVFEKIKDEITVY